MNGQDFQRRDTSREWDVDALFWETGFTRQVIREMLDDGFTPCEVSAAWNAQDHFEVSDAI